MMQPNHPQAALLATAIWVIFTLGIVFSSPRAPGDKGWTPTHAGRTPGFAALASPRPERGR